MAPGEPYQMTPPCLNIRVVPETEREAFLALVVSVNGLASYIRMFRSAVELFEYAEVLQEPGISKHQCGNWQLVAARDGAMSMFHFQRILEQSGISLKNCPTVRALLDHEKLRSARRRFNAVFPDVARVRHAVAHSAEMGETAANFQRNSFSGSADLQAVLIEEAKHIRINNCLMGRRFTTTHDGEIIEYELGYTTLGMLCSIATEFYDGFSAIDSSPRGWRTSGGDSAPWPQASGKGSFLGGRWGMSLVAATGKAAGFVAGWARRLEQRCAFHLN